MRKKKKIFNFPNGSCTHFTHLLDGLLLNGHLDETNRLYFILWQLGYIIYRRVLRYYSGEEDGLGEALIHFFLSMIRPYILFCLSFISFDLKNRYEEGIIKRCREKVCDSSQKTYHT